MWLFVGLGNPGDKYQKNRHNIGFMAVEQIAHRHNFSNFKTSKFKGEIAEGKIDGEKVILLKPDTYMNLSGQAVQPLAQFYKIPLHQIIVFHDELDLEPTKTRVKKGGGAGGHNGLKSIDQSMGKDYFRVRMGIGHPGDKDRVHGYVLGDFSKKEQNDWLYDYIESIANASPYLIQGENDKFMNDIAVEMRGKAP